MKPIQQISTVSQAKTIVLFGFSATNFPNLKKNSRDKSSSGIIKLIFMFFNDIVRKN